MRTPVPSIDGVRACRAVAPTYSVTRDSAVAESSTTITLATSATRDSAPTWLASIDISTPLLALVSWPTTVPPSPLAALITCACRALSWAT